MGEAFAFPESEKQRENDGVEEVGGVGGASGGG